MPTAIHCPNPACAKSATLADEYVGRAVRCRHCGTRFTATATVEFRETMAGATAPSQAPTEPERPTRIGRFEIRAQVGAGAFGTVYRAYDPQLDREVAIKVPQAGVLDSPKRVERFQREAKSAAGLRHPNIVPVYEAGHDGSRHYIASAFIAGRLLAEEVGERGIDARRAAKIVSELAEAVAYAHARGIVHRDIKPANVMLDEDGRPLLMDFGLATRADESEKLTHDGAVLGTPAYMAPEQAAGQKGEAQPASDQYSLGVVLYEMLTGQLPFDGPAAVVLFNTVNREPKPPRALRPDLPRDLEAICLRAMAKRPQDRYADCRALANDLSRWLDGRAVAARRSGVGRRGAQRGRRIAVWAGLGAVVVVVGGVALALALRAGSHSRTEASPSVASRVPDEGPVTASAPAAETAPKLAAPPKPVAEPTAPVTAVKPVMGPDPAVEAERLTDGARVLAVTKQEYAAALAACDRALELRPGLTRALQYRALSLHHLKRYDEAIRDYSDLARRDGERDVVLTAYTGRGLTYQAAGRYDEAVADFSEVLKRDPTRQVCLYHRSQCHEAKGDYRAALDDIDAAINDRADPTTRTKAVPAEWHVQRATVYHRLDDVGNARRDRDLALKRNPKLADDPQVKEVDAFIGKPPEPIALEPSRPGAAFKELAIYTGHDKSQVNGAALTPNGQLALTAGWDCTVQAWSVKTLQRKYTLKYISSIWGLAMSPDGRQAVYAGGRSFKDGKYVDDDDFPIIGIDVSTGNELFRLKGHAGVVNCLRYLPDGKRLLSSSNDRTMRLWEPAQSPSAVRVFLGHADSVYGIDSSPDGRLGVSCAWDGSVFLWDLGRETPLRPLIGHDKPVWNVAFSPDGKSVLTAGFDKTVRLWDVASGREMRSFLHPTGLNCVKWLPDGRHAVTTSGLKPSEQGTRWVAARYDHCVRLVDVLTGKVLAKYESSVCPQHIEIFKDGRRVLVVGNSGVRVLELPR